MGRGAVSEPVAALGYDPHPEIDRYAGNPLPEMDDPISWTEQRAYIAGYVWTQGPAWSVLRNANEYLWSVMSNASVDDVRFTIRDIERSRWLRALREAKPGKIGGGAYRLFSILFETGPEPFETDWPVVCHPTDVRPRPARTVEERLSLARHFRAAADRRAQERGREPRLPGDGLRR